MRQEDLEIHKFFVASCFKPRPSRDFLRVLACDSIPCPSRWVAGKYQNAITISNAICSQSQHRQHNPMDVHKSKIIISKLSPSRYGLAETRLEIRNFPARWRRDRAKGRKEKQFIQCRLMENKIKSFSGEHVPIRTTEHSKILILPAREMNPKRMCWHLNRTPHACRCHRTTDREEEEEILQLGRKLISIYLIAFHNYIIPHPLIVRCLLTSLRTLRCTSQFSLWIFIERAKVLSSVMSYGRFLLRKHHFLLQVGVARSDGRRWSQFESFVVPVFSNLRIYLKRRKFWVLNLLYSLIAQ